MKKQQLLVNHGPWLFLLYIFAIVVVVCISYAAITETFYFEGENLCQKLWKERADLLHRGQTVGLSSNKQLLKECGCTGKSSKK